MLKSKPMKVVAAIFVCAMVALGTIAQSPAQKIYETERAFEKAVAEKGINAGFIEYMSPDGLLFLPDAVNGREWWTKRAVSPASLTWNPIWIEVSSNGALAYSIGNGIYRPAGKADPNMYYSHYLSIWNRQPNGEYRAVIDAAINHERPASMPTEWKSPAVSGNTKLQNSAGDHAVNFYTTAETSGAAKAYKSFLADDAFLIREGTTPISGKSAAVEHLEKARSTIKFAKRKTFIEAGDLAWVTAKYSIVDKSGTETENGNFIQVWKLRGGKWLIAADMMKPLPKPTTDLK